MSTFFSLPQLKSLVSGRRTDLQKIRAMAADLNKRVDQVSNSKQYTSDFITREVAKIREIAQQQATEYLTKAETFVHLKSIKEQAEFWTVKHFLSRARAAADGKDMGYLALLVALPRTPLDSIGEIADDAAAASDWASVGACHNELRWRSPTDSDALATLTMMEQTISIPDVTSALELISEGAQLEEFLTYSLRTLSQGGEDLGIRMEETQRLGRERDTARNQVLAQEELQKQSAVTQWQLRAS